MDTLSIDVANSPLYPDIATLRLNGFLYANTLPHLDKTIQSVSAEKKNLIFDLSQTNYISSGGWGLIITAFHRIREAGGALVLACMKPEVNDAFELMEYHKVMRSFPSVENALKEAFDKPAIKL